LIYLAYH